MNYGKPKTDSTWYVTVRAVFYDGPDMRLRVTGRDSEEAMSAAEQIATREYRVMYYALLVRKVLTLKQVRS